MRIVPALAAQALFLGGLAASAQTTDDAAPVPTLRLSTSLIEVPLLIRGRGGELPRPSLPAGSIEVKLGDGEWFRPNNVRQEGQEPIALAILLDLNSPVSDLPRPLTQALSSLKSLSLTPKDQVSLFVMDCSSVRVTNISADPAQVADAVKSAIEPPGQSGKQTCKEGGRLWDTLAAVSHVLRNVPSRRVVLAITEGKDHGSVLAPKELADLAQDSAVAIFQLDPTEGSGPVPQVDSLLALHGLPLIAQSSGGLTLGVEPSSLRQQVQRVVTLLRGRYIVQLRVPPDAKPGHIPLSARVTELTSETFSVRITGNWAPLPNPDEVVAIPSQVAKVDAAPATNPAPPVVAAAAAEPPPAPVVPVPAVVAQTPQEPKPGANPKQGAATEAAPVSTDEQWAARADAVMQTSSRKGDSSVPTLKVSIRLTLVDVTVTDGKGHPVQGLTQDDFTVKEDGKPQPIKNFEELGTGARATPQLPPNVYSNRLAPNTQAVNVLLFDQVTIGLTKDLELRPTALKDAKDASLNYLKTMPEGTRVAVLEMNGSGLRTVQGFTSDRELLTAAVNSITFQRVMESRWDPPDAPSLPGVPRERPNYTMLCNAMNFQSAQALNAMNQLALFVSGLPGRKNVMWFTLGVPWLTQYQPFSQSPNLVCISNFTPQLQAVYGRLTAGRIALYPINPLGVQFEGNLSGGHDSLDDLARSTGGKAHFDNDFSGALQEDTATGSDYYALSYVPPLPKYDGKYHKIEVAVDRPGVHLEYRKGYTSLDINGPLLEQEKSRGKAAAPKTSFQTAMGYGAPATTQVTFAVRAVPDSGPAKPGVIGSLNPELKGKPLVRYSFDFDLPRDKITLEAQPDGSQRGSFEVAIAAYDVQGRVLNSLDEKRSFALKPDAVAGFLQKPFVVPVEIDLPPGALSVRAGVMDQPSQQMGVVEILLSVAK